MRSGIPQVYVWGSPRSTDHQFNCNLSNLASRFEIASWERLVFEYGADIQHRREREASLPPLNGKMPLRLGQRGGRAGRTNTLETGGGTHVGQSVGQSRLFV